MEEKIEPLIEAGHVVPCPSSQFASNALLAAKKGPDGAWTDHRFCVDYRAINTRCEPIPHRPPVIQEIFETLGKSIIYSKLDHRNGFGQCIIKEEDQPKTSFWYGNRFMMFLRLPFGLKNGPSYYQGLVEHHLREANLTHCTRAYIDDIVVYSLTPELHLHHVAQVLELLTKINLLVHPTKRIFGAEVIEYLGHNISPLGTSPHAAKVAAIMQLPTPTDLHTLRQVLGYLSYYRCYCENFSAIARPMTILTGKNTPFVWGPEQQSAFDTLKKEICTEGKALRRPDPARDFILHTEFSKQGISAVLGQKYVDGNEYIVATISRSLNKHEQNYYSYQGEALAAVWGCRSFRHHLLGVKFRLVTDHPPLLYLMSAPNLVGQHARWALTLMDLDFTIEHRPGIKHNNADVTSRFPMPTTLDGTGARLDEDTPEDSTEHLHQQPTAKEIMDASAVDKFALATAIDSYGTDPKLWSLVYTGHDLVEPEMHSFLPPAPEWSSISSVAIHQQQLRRAANEWLHNASPLPPALVHTSTHPALCTDTLQSDQINGLLSAKITVYEPFGGLCAGLEMLFRNGISVNRYIYSDISPVAQAIANHRLQQLSETYSHQLLPPAWHTALSTLPHDVRQVDHLTLTQAGAADGTQWMLIAGWECQDLSPAGSNARLDGKKSSTFYPLLNILSQLQQIQTKLKPVFFFENAAMQHNFSSEVIRTEHYSTICSNIGQPIFVDAAQMGSYAHRLRNYWTNAACADQVSAVIKRIIRPELLVDRILEQDHTSQTVKFDDKPPFAICNYKGYPRAALPTLVAYKGSHSFRDGGPGMVLNTITNTLREPTAQERERAMGYSLDSTAAPGVTDQQRCATLGNCMDSYAMQGIFSICLAIHRAGQLTQQPIAAVTHCKPATLANKYGPGLYLMLQEGWQPGTGLGPDSSGITQPIQLPFQLTRRAIGYRGQVSSKIPQHLKLRQPVHFQHAGLRPAAMVTVTDAQPLIPSDSADVFQLGG